MAKKKFLEYCEECGAKKDFSSKRKCKKCHKANKKRESQSLLLAIKLGDGWDELMAKKQQEKTILGKIKSKTSWVLHVGWGRWISWLILIVLMFLMK